MERSVRSLLSIFLLVAALFAAMNRIVQNAPPIEWWPVLVLVGLAVLLYFLEWRGRGASAEPLVEPGQSSLDGYRQVAASPAPAPAIAPKVKSEAETDYDDIVEAYGSIRDTDVRSDGMASAATTDTQEARSVKDMVENIMDVGATGTFEEVDEIAGGPVESISKALPKTAPPAPAPSPAPKAAKAAASLDDLTIIEGIGPKMAAALKSAGIDTFARLSSTSEEDLRAAIGAAGMRFAPSIPTWAQQASLADKADWEGLKKLQANLKAGRKK